MSEEKEQFKNVTHYTKVDVQPGGINIQHVEHLHQADVLKALGIELEIKKSTVSEDVPETHRENIMPEELQTEAAKELLGKFQAAGMLDENYQPINLSRAFRAVLANTLAEELKIKRKWAVFEALWQMKALATAYTKALSQDNVVEFIKKIEKTIES